MPGSIQNAPVTLQKFVESHGLFLTLLAAAALKPGQLVNISGDNTVAAVDAGTDFPVGIISVGATAAGEKVTVLTNLNSDLKAIAGAALAAGALVKPTGAVDANGRPTYVAAAVGDFVGAVVIKGGALNAEIRVGILRAPVKI